MVETRIGISELKKEGSDTIEELNEFLKKRTEAEIRTETNEIIIEDKEGTPSRLHVRLLVRKFLHNKELKDYYRVIGGKENTLTVKEKKAASEE